MSQRLIVTENILQVVIDITAEGDVLLLHCAALPFVPETIHPVQAAHFRLVEVQVTGEDRTEHHDTKYLGLQPGRRLRYLTHRFVPNASGRVLEIEQVDTLSGLKVLSSLQFFTNLPVLRAWTTVCNQGEHPLGLEYVSSFALTGLAKEGNQAWEAKMRLGLPHNSWFQECQWRQTTLPEMGLLPMTRALPYQHSMKRLLLQGVGTWSTAQYLPMGYLENQEAGAGFLWQIEPDGAWVWELSDVSEQLYLRLSGPTDQESQWWYQLESGATFTSTPAAFVVAAGNRTEQRESALFEQCMATLTAYRRLIRRPHPDYTVLPVIFNDYMNCLNANPTTDQELPLIRRAAEAGCEIYCIDAGWYTPPETDWWETVGEWLPDQHRFEGGLSPLLETIRAHGMRPGLWVEIEVIGIQSPLARQLPDSWFFCRHGKRVIDHGRYQLDFRSPDVCSFADAVIDRLVQSYGVGYIKIDYNINAGVGTERDATSPGVGLLEHRRAYFAWLASVMDRYPELVLENCGSGGLRMDYGFLQLHSIQSTSDQPDYRFTTPIAAAAPTAVTPEQGAVWAYPLAADPLNAVVVNMVNALLGRIHLSGQLADLSPEAFALVQEAIVVYKQYRGRLPSMVPLWPLGLPAFDSPWICLGLRDTSNTSVLLAVWRQTSPQTTVALPFPEWSQTAIEVTTLFPGASDGIAWNWSGEKNILSVTLSSPQSACLLWVTWRMEESSSGCSDVV